MTIEIFRLTSGGLTVAPSMSLYSEVAASRSGTAMATWFSLPRLQTEAGGEAAADINLMEEAGAALRRLVTAWRKNMS